MAARISTAERQPRIASDERLAVLERQVRRLRQLKIAQREIEALSPNAPQHAPALLRRQAD